MFDVTLSIRGVASLALQHAVVVRSVTCISEHVRGLLPTRPSTASARTAAAEDIYRNGGMPVVYRQRFGACRADQPSTDAGEGPNLLNEPSRHVFPC